MADCECLPGCIFFNDKMVNMPSTSGMYKRIYCQGDNSKCARYMVFKAKGKGSVPGTLFPNQFEKAKEIIAS